MTNFTQTEKRILKAMLADVSRVWGIEAIARVVYGNDERPATYKQSISQVMRTTQLKAKIQGIEIKRLTRLGRGSPAKYQVTKCSQSKKDAFLLGEDVHK